MPSYNCHTVCKEITYVGINLVAKFRIGSIDPPTEKLFYNRVKDDMKDVLS